MPGYVTSAHVWIVRKRTGKRAYEPIVGRLPPRVAARVDLIAPWIAEAWGGPLNGQVKRAEAFRQIIECFPFRAIVETGTYRGTSTDFLRRVSGLTVYSVERNPRFFEYSRLRFRNDRGVVVRLGDSREFLWNLARDAEVPHDRVFFYLDAHWRPRARAEQSMTELPIAEELLLVTSHWTHSVVAIDDFQVPHDPGYGFDDYGGRLVLRREYLPSEVLDVAELFWPAAPASEETGARRGCIVLAQPGIAAEKLRQLDSLRPDRVTDL